MKTLGIIGTGHLAGFLVEGLARVKANYAVTVSPRNAARAQELRQKFGVRIASNNQEIVDGCDLVVISVLPQEAAKVMAPLKFRADQTILSVMAGVSLAAIKELVGPANSAVAMMPGLANAYNIGPSVLHPENQSAHELLALLGPVHNYESQEAFTTASVMGAFSGMSFLLMRDVINWFATNGLDPTDARHLVAETLIGNATVVLDSPFAIAEITRGVVTPGGITETGWLNLEQGPGWPAALAAVLNRIGGEH